MQGNCPTCNRVYDISDEFVAMGGKAKCPHCIEELVFSATGAPAGKLDPRQDQTRIDPNRNRAATRVDPEEIDARCDSCDRRFKIDNQYLRMGGQARCPHCAEELIFDVPQSAPPPKPPPDDLWDEESARTHELDDQSLDPYSSTGEVSLPELEGFRSEGPDSDGLPEASEPASQDLEDDEGDEDDEDDALPTAVVTSPFGRGQEPSDEFSMPTPDEPEEPDDRVVVGSLEEPGAEDRLGEKQDWSFSPQTDQETLDHLEPSPGFDLPIPGGDDVTREVSKVEPPPEAFARADQPARPAAAPFAGLAETDDWAAAAAAWAEGGFQPDQMPAFIRSEAATQAGPASEPGPTFGSQPPVERTVPSGQSLDALRAKSLPADAPADSVEVSDADIIMLDEAEVDMLPAPSPAAELVQQDSWAARASREVASKQVAPAPKPAPRESLLRRVPLVSKLSHPPILAGVLGLLALAIISLLWVLLAGSEDVAGVAFPSQGLPAEQVQAPVPREADAKKTALQAYGLGNRQAHLGRFEEAIAEFQRASSIDPGFPHPHRAMGSIYAAIGKLDLSRAAFETYLQLEPRGPDAEQVRKILKRYQGQ